MAKQGERVRVAWIPSDRVLEFFRHTLPAGERTLLRGLGVPVGTQVVSAGIAGGRLGVELANDAFDPVPGGSAIPEVELEF